MQTKRAIVIGAGFGGLSAAALLAKDDWQVDVFEKNHMAGGRAQIWKEKGFVFDMGPSWYLMPDVFEDFWALFGKKPEDYYQLKRLDPSYRIWFGENDYLDLPSDLQEAKKLFATLEVDGDKKLEKYLDQAAYQYEIAMRKFINRPYLSWRDLLDKELFWEGSKLSVFKGIGKLADSYFTNDKAKKILLYTIVFLGGSPTITPALYSIMSHIDFNLGVWYPDGGIGEVAGGIERLAKDLGAEFHYKKPVEKILVEHGKAVGVIAEGRTHLADLVVVNADYHHAETHLLEKEFQTYPESYWKKKTMAPSALIFYLGIGKNLKGLQHHTLFFDSDWQSHFETMFERPAWPQDPSFYVCCPSKTDRTVAPKGMENLFVLVPVASGLDDSEDVRAHYYEEIMSRIERLTGEEIRKHVTVKRVFAHKDFMSEYNAYQGTALGLAHTLWQTALFRPKQKSEKVRNLYFTGQYTHPGIGMPITLLSSQIVRDLITHDFS